MPGPDVPSPRGSPAPSGSPPGRPRRLSRLQRRSGAGRGKHPPGHRGSVPPAARPEPLGGCSPALEGPGEEWEQEPTPLQKDTPHSTAGVPEVQPGKSGPDLGIKPVLVPPAWALRPVSMGQAMARQISIFWGKAEVPGGFGCHQSPSRH